MVEPPLSGTGWEVVDNVNLLLKPFIQGFDKLLSKTNVLYVDFA